MRPDALLDHWIGPCSADGAFDRARLALWFGRNDETDARLRARFGEALAQAARGELDDWAETPRGRLALVILLDQLSRNLYRGRPEAFAQDARARRLAEEALAAGEDAQLCPIERTFLYLPLEHAEDPEAQRASVARFRALREAVQVPHRPPYDEFLQFAIRHRVVIDRFGRFPHRNATLGRTDTPLEARYLSWPGFRF